MKHFLKSLLCRVRGHRWCYQVHAGPKFVIVGYRCERCDEFVTNSIHQTTPEMIRIEQLYRDLYSGFDGVRH